MKALDRIAAAAVATLLLSAGCGGGEAPDARYPSRPTGCPVKTYPGDPPVPDDDLGLVSIDCASTGASCARQLLDAVCARGGDVAWGTGDNALTATHLVAHAGHTRRATKGPRERGCEVQTFADAPPMRTENIGPVSALCSLDDPKDVCLRELQDQTCLLGGDVVWQVEGPAVQGNKQRMEGRAAHSR